MVVIDVKDNNEPALAFKCFCSGSGSLHSNGSSLAFSSYQHQIINIIIINIITIIIIIIIYTVIIITTTIIEMRAVLIYNY